MSAETVMNSAACSLEDPEEEISLFLSRTLLELERSGPVRTRMIFDPSCLQ